MVAPAAPPAPQPSGAPNSPEPPCPLAPGLRSDLAHARASGRSWKALARERNYDPGALRRAAEADPEFAPALDRASAEVARKCEAEGLARLRQLATGDDDRLALKAAEALLRHGMAVRREQTRLAVEETRAKAKAEAARARAAGREGEGEGAAGARESPEPWPPTHEQMAELRECRAAGQAAGEGPLARRVPEVYLWGGRHITGRSAQPDASDRRVRVVKDNSVGCGPRGAVYWVVPFDAVPWAPHGDDYRPEDQPSPDIWAGPPQE